MPPITIFWFRQDLRLSDNPGLYEAAQQGKILPIYILDDEGAGEVKMQCVCLTRQTDDNTVQALGADAVAVHPGFADP